MDSLMNIELSVEDLRRMPQALSANLLDWLKYERLKVNPSSRQSSPLKEKQITLSLSDPITKKQPPVSKSVTSKQPSVSEDIRSEHSHIRFSELFDAGITRPGMSLRVRLKRSQAREFGRDYLNGLAISSRGTVVYEGEEFNKPSPLATKLNGSSVNGWEYLEVKREGEWVRLEILRQQMRRAL
jgi:hypothetical protein